MSTKIASFYAEISAKDTLTPALRGTKGALDSVKTMMGSVAMAAGILAGAYLAGKKVVDDTVGSYVDLANSVRTLNQVNGDSSENNSRLIQTLDDYKISTDQVLVAQRAMAKEGKSMTIPTLMEMSDAYLRLNNGAEKQQFLTNNFGKAGVAFAEVMSKGSDAISAQADSISKNLILTDQAVQKARAYETAQDNLADAAEGLKVAIGQQLAPVLTTVANNMATTIEGASTMGSAFDGLSVKTAENARSYENYNRAMMDFFDTLSFGEKVMSVNAFKQSLMSEAMYNAISASDQNKDATGRATKAQTDYAAALEASKLSMAGLDEASVAAMATNASFVGLLDQMQAAETSFQETSMSLEEERAGLIQEKEEYIFNARQWGIDQIEKYQDALKDTTLTEEERAKIAGKIAWLEGDAWLNVSDTVTGLNDKIEENSNAIEENARKHQEANQKIIFGYISQELAADGLTEQETTGLLALGVKWGIYSDTIIAEATTARNEANAILAGIEDKGVKLNIGVTVGLTDFTSSDSNLARSLFDGTFVFPKTETNITAVVDKKQVDDLMTTMTDFEKPHETEAKVIVSFTGDLVRYDFLMNNSNGGGSWNGDYDYKWTGGVIGSGQTALVGDMPGGIPTPYSEMVEAIPGGGVKVYNANETRSKMGGGMRSFAGGGEIGGGKSDPIDYDRLAIIVRDAVLQAVR